MDIEPLPRPGASTRSPRISDFRYVQRCTLLCAPRYFVRVSTRYELSLRIFSCFSVRVLRSNRRYSNLRGNALREALRVRENARLRKNGGWGEESILIILDAST